MKKKVFYIMSMLMAVSLSTHAQSLSVQDIEAQTGEETQLVVSLAEGTSMTALQFNLSLPEGVSLKDNSDTYGTTLGEATDGHTLSVQPLASGDLLFILYSMEQKAFSDGELLRIPLKAGDAANTANGKLYTVRTATVDAVSHPCADVSFSAQVTEAEPVTYKDTPLTKDMFKEWDGCTATSQVINENVGGTVQLNQNIPSGGTIYGDPSVVYTKYADITGCHQMVITGTPGMQLRVLMNRLEVGNGGGDGNGGALTELNPTIGTDGKAVVDLSGYEFVHLNAIKNSWSSSEGIITSIILDPTDDTTDISIVNTKAVNNQQRQIFTLDGRAAETLQKGVNIIRYSDGTTKKALGK